MRVFPQPDPESERGLRVAGLDEVGRGPLAGPVVAAAVVLPPGLPWPPGLVDDSKRMTHAARLRADALIRAVGAVGLGEASVAEVEALNPLGASLLAMARALAALPFVPDLALVDGGHLPALPCPARAIPGGDRLSLSIAAASVVAKVWRDALMVALAPQHPEYGWERNKGYGSQSHIRALQVHGPTPHHRRTFAPVHKMLWQGRIADA